MRMYSPDGKATIDAHPSKVPSLEKLGWTHEKKSSRKKRKEPEPVVEEQATEEAEPQEENES